MIIRTAPTTRLYRWLTAPATKIRRAWLLMHVQSENRRLRLERDQAYAERDAARTALARLGDQHAALLDLDEGLVTVPDTIPGEWVR